MRGLVLLAAMLIASPVAAQVAYPPSVTQAAVDQVAAKIPLPANAPPPAEIAGGTTGTMTTRYALENHSHPRITDSPTVYTVTGGTFSGTFRAGLFVAKPTIALTWVTTGAIGPVSCEMRSITASAFTGRCTTLLGLVPAGAGIEVNVVALPNTAP